MQELTNEKALMIVTTVIMQQAKLSMEEADLVKNSLLKLQEAIKVKEILKDIKKD